MGLLSKIIASVSRAEYFEYKARTTTPKRQHVRMWFSLRGGQGPLHFAPDHQYQMSNTNITTGAFIFFYIPPTR